MHSDEVHVETELESSPDEVYNFLVNPHQIAVVLPGLIGLSEVPALPLKVGDSYNYQYQVAGVVLEGKWIITQLDEPSHYSARTTGGADSEWHYEVTASGNGSKVGLTVRYDPPASIMEKVSAPLLQRLNKHDGESLMNNLKVVLELRKH